MLGDYEKQEIDKISKEVLKSSKSIGIFPTPVDEIINYSEFAIDNKLDLQNIELSFLDSLVEKSKKTLTSGLDKVMGVFDRSEKTIYIDLSLDSNVGKKNFVKLHEVGHGIIPWQTEYMLCLDNENTVSQEIDEQFEAEANYFASKTLFQGDVFKEEAKKLKLELNSAIKLAKSFGASVHSTLRNYVLSSPNRCALLVLTPIKNSSGNKAICETRNLFYSDPFTKEFGELSLPKQFGFKWSFIQDFKFKRKFNQHGKIELNTENGENVDCSYHFFNNSYNSFILIFPKGESNKARTKVIVRDIT